MAQILIRRASADDAEIIARHRVHMFEEMDFGTPEHRQHAGIDFIEWVRPLLDRGEYCGWFALAPDGSVAAGVGLWIHTWPPTPGDEGRARGWIGNVFTEPAYRGQGLARRLMETLLHYARAQNLAMVWLHATPDGRPLYESLGFEAKPNEMIKRLD